MLKKFSKKKSFGKDNLQQGKVNCFIKMFFKMATCPKQSFWMALLYRFDCANNTIHWHSHICTLVKEGRGFVVTGSMEVIKTLSNIRDGNS